MLKWVMALVAAVALGLAGCGVGGIDGELIVDVTSEFETENSVSKSESAQLIFPEKKPIPEGGWTYETIMDSIWINGQYARFPCKLEDLGEGLEFDEKVWCDVVDTHTVVVGLMLHGEWVALVRVYDETGEDYVNNGYIYSVFSETDQRFQYLPIAVNGIKFGDTLDDLAEYFDSDAKVRYVDELEYNFFSSFSDFHGIDDEFIQVRLMGDDESGISSISFTLIQPY